MQRYGQESEFKDRLVAVNRVSKTVKGGRNMRFSALVVVGDEKGRVGAGMGKAAEIPEAIRKATEDAKKHLVTVPMDGTTIPHNTTGYFSTSKVVLLPAPEGTGVIAGGAARAVLELAGVADIRTKSFGTNNPINMVKATLEASSSCAARNRSRRCAARPWKNCWAEEVKDNAESYAHQVPDRVSAGSQGDCGGAGPAQGWPDRP